METILNYPQPVAEAKRPKHESEALRIFAYTRKATP